MTGITLILFVLTGSSLSSANLMNRQVAKLIRFDRPDLYVAALESAGILEIRSQFPEPDYRQTAVLNACRMWGMA